MYGRGKKLSKPKTQHIRNPFILKKIWKIKKLDIGTFFETEEEKKEKNQRKKEHNETIVKDRIIWDIRALFEEQEDYH